jgi:hypothetical protein
MRRQQSGTHLAAIDDVHGVGAGGGHLGGFSWVIS